MNDPGPDQTDKALASIRIARDSAHTAVLQLASIVVTQENPGHDELPGDTLDSLREQMDALIRIRQKLGVVLSNYDAC